MKATQEAAAKKLEATEAAARRELQDTLAQAAATKEAIAAAAALRSSGVMFPLQTQQSVTSPAGNFSPSTSSAWAASPDHSGFNPNLAFPHIPLPRTTSASCSPVYSPAYATTSAPSLLRRESIPYAAKMEDIIAAGSEAHVAVGSEAFFAEDTDFAQHADEETQDFEVDVEGEETQEAPEDLGGKGKKKRKSGEPSLSRYKWTAKEDECLAEAWKMVSMDPITGSKTATRTG
jgi:hypothetical protein